jgi:hypothetical protein
VLGDTHLACKNGSVIFAKHQQKFFDNVLLPFVQQYNYPIFQLGDLFDQRKFINFAGLETATSGFLDKLPKSTIMNVLIGNHDIYYKESLKVNAPSLLLKHYTNINVITSPTTIDGIDVIPWITDENRSNIQQFIENSTSKICCGHFEIAGFSMQRGIPSHGGLDTKMFNKYKLVLSGHYHTRSTIGNITYVGTPYELTWSDYRDQKGFHVLDTETLELEFIENPYTLYNSFIYNDIESFNISDIDEDQVFEKYIKIIVANKTDYFKFDQFVAKIQSYNPYDIKIIENFSSKPLGEINEEIHLQDTLSVLDSYVDSMQLTDVNDIKIYMRNLYTQALDL